MACRHGQYHEPLYWIHCSEGLAHVKGWSCSSTCEGLVMLRLSACRNAAAETTPELCVHTSWTMQWYRVATACGITDGYGTCRQASGTIEPRIEWYLFMINTVAQAVGRNLSSDFCLSSDALRQLMSA